MNLIYHYTYQTAFHSILKDNEIKVSETEKSWGWRPAAWFSKEPLMEPTAIKALKMETNVFRKMSMQEQFQKFGIYRIGINADNKDLIDWKQYQHLSGIPTKDYLEMTMHGIKYGAKPKNWLCLFRNVPITEWVCMERYDGKKWIDLVEEMEGIEREKKTQN